MKKILIIVGIILLVIVGFYFIIRSGNQANDDRRAVIDTVMTALKSGQVDQVYQMTSKKFKETMKEDAFEQSVTRTALFSPTTQYQVSYVEQGRYSGTLTDAQGKEHTFRFTFDSQDGKEVLQNMEFDYPKEEVTATVPVKEAGRIDEIRVGTESIDFMDSPRATRLDSSLGTLHIGALVARANKAKAKMVLEYVPTGDKIGPVEDVPSGWYYFLGRGSFQSVGYEVTRPTNGWLAGAYRVHLGVDGGVQSVFDFTIVK